MWSLSNENLQSWAMSVVLWGAVLAVFGWVALPFLLIQAVCGFSLLEVVNYLEHYGLPAAPPLAHVAAWSAACPSILAMPTTPVSA